MFYYLSLAFYTRSDYQDASRYISQIPDNKVFSAKVFFLEGQIAESVNDTDAALIAYGKALKMNRNHAKSRLRISDIYNQRGKIKDAREHLEFMVNHPGLLSSKDLALTYYLHSILSEQDKKFEIALADIERAVRLDKDDHNYLLQLYSMRAKAGESIAKVRVSAKMYYYLGEGERLIKAGKYQEALTQFLQARQASNDSPIPLVKIGDMFGYLHDLGNARLNYKMAADRAPNSIDIWSKYIDVLIQSYEWDEASKAMERFRQLPVSQSAIDKAAGDMYAKQGQYDKAQIFYRKAMGRETIDPQVYIAYAKSLMATQNYKEAPFFFALAQRFDPLNIEATLGVARCVANTDSVDHAIAMLQNDLEKGGSKAELLGAIAEFQIQKGEWEQAQKTVEQAMSANPDYAYPWKLQAQIYMNNSSDKKALDKALFAYQAYSERNASDPSGYLERYRIFSKKGEYEKADDELSKIFGIYPKYPNLHYYKGELYRLEGNHQKSVEEYNTELANNPYSTSAMIALGKQYLEMGGYNEALGQFNKAMQVDPRSAEAKQQSCWANYLLKNYTGAVALCRAAIAVDPGNPLIYKRLGLAYWAISDKPNAAQAFQKYLEMEPDAPDRAEIERYK
jgi:tetratricopeptide (TPR) repeat protein